MLGQIEFFGGTADATFTTDIANVKNLREAELLINVTAISGSPTMQAAVEVSPDTATWFPIQTVTGLGSVGKTRVTLTNFGSFMRLTFSVGGSSPGVTFAAFLDGK